MVGRDGHGDHRRAGLRLDTHAGTHPEHPHDPGKLGTLVAAAPGRSGCNRRWRHTARRHRWLTVAPLITLTTDFGHKGPFVGVMKGAILRQLPEAVIVDLSHEIPAHWPIEAGFWVARSYAWFPPGTVHV
ncbi:MAG: SAM-dependent chlorinase/fluorinase, partial [Gammaproteobacteria bacterium]|nr:SAM-dependent chlorinase/fluorinase [Gammaproteobacteria bacterium]